MTRVKICGITNLEDALHAVEKGADELGFNFYSKSLRYISPDAAKAIIDELPVGISKVGVFVNMPLAGVLETAQIAGLSAIQLHGDEGRAYVRELRSKVRLKIIQAVRMKPVIAAIHDPTLDAHAILLDSYVPNEYGGTGKAFDWNRAKEFADSFPTVYLAGGLHPDNVEEAINIVKPYAVDVASGVESAPGRKDPRKVEAFIKAAKLSLESKGYAAKD